MFKSLFKKFDNGIPLHQAQCVNISDIGKFLADHREYLSHRVFYYIGNCDVLVSIVKDKNGRGEKDINHLSLVYIGACGKNTSRIVVDTETSADSSHATIMLEEDMWDTAKLKEIAQPNFQASYALKSDSGKIITMEKAVFCKDSVYLCSK